MTSWPWSRGSRGSQKPSSGRWTGKSSPSNDRSVDCSFSLSQDQMVFIPFWTVTEMEMVSSSCRSVNWELQSSARRLLYTAGPAGFQRASLLPEFPPARTDAWGCCIVAFLLAADVLLSCCQSDSDKVQIDQFLDDTISTLNTHLF